MESVINFLESNWRLVLEGALIIASFIILLLRKKPVKVVDTLKELIIRVLPALICSAEKTELKAKDKKSFVLSNLQSTLKEFGYGDDIITQYLPFASEQVEVILSTPQKKEIKYEK